MGEQGKGWKCDIGEAGVVGWCGKCGGELARAAGELTKFLMRQGVGQKETLLVRQ